MFRTFVGYLALFAAVLLGGKTSGMLSISWLVVAAIWWAMLTVASLILMACVCRKYPKQ